MSTARTHRKTAHVTATNTNPNAQEITMSTSIKSHARRKTAHAIAANTNPNDQEATMSTTPIPTSVPSNAGTAGASPLFQSSPPSNALIPPPPTGFIPSKESYSGVIPRLIELGALSGAISDLQSFSDYATVLGDTAPPFDEILAAFTLANEWSTMRKASFLWDKFAQMQEGIAWTTLRPLMEKLAPAFALASAHNASLPTKFASLTTLLNAKKTIGKKGASTRALNKKAEAEGKPPIHGKAGRLRKKASDKAIVAAASSGTAPAVTPAPVAVAPVTSTPAPAAASMTEAATSVPAPAAPAHS